MKYAFVWQTEDLNMALFECVSDSEDSAWRAFLEENPDQGVIAVFAGSDMECLSFEP